MKTQVYHETFFLVMDGEFGGIGLDKSLLSLSFIFASYIPGVNSTIQIRDTLNLYIKPNDGIYRLTPTALEINKIDITKHDKMAVTEKMAGTALYECLKSWYGIAQDKLIPVGHNFYGDIAQICDKLMSKNTWDQFVSYRAIDTAGIAQFMRLNYRLPDTISCSLAGLVEHFKIEIDGNAHEAQYDTLATLKVFEKLIQLY